MTASRILAIVATILFAVAFIIVVFAHGNADLVRDCTLLGLTAFAAAHAV